MAKVSPIQLQQFLKGLDYPSNKQDLIEQAELNDADDDILAILHELPDIEYESPIEVSEELGSLD